MNQVKKAPTESQPSRDVVQPMPGAKAQFKILTGRKMLFAPIAGNVLEVSGRRTTWRFAIPDGPVTIRLCDSYLCPETIVQIPPGGKFGYWLQIASCFDSEGNKLIDWPDTVTDGIVCTGAILLSKMVDNILVDGSLSSMTEILHTDQSDAELRFEELTISDTQMEDD
ncbi:hypothetical protein MMC13_005250 [Lambiella insularis]|nr:hypothetical protein [Lambiella insularis]